MATRAGVGLSQLTESYEAGKRAALGAVDGLGGSSPQFALVFGTAGYDQAELLRGVREAVPGVPLSGCSGEGVIALAESLECDHAVAVMLLSSDAMRFEGTLVEGYERDPSGAAERLAAWVDGFEDRVGLLVFPDGLVGNCKRFLGQLESRLSVPLSVAGGTCADAMAFERTYQYGDDRAISSGVAAVLIRGKGRMEVAVSHGCAPIGLERTVTRAADGWVYEIDHQRAWSVFKEYLDGDPQDLNSEGIVHLCVGERLAPDESEDYAPYVIHTPLSLDKERGALFFPSGGLETGQRIRLTRRDPQRIRASAKACADKIVNGGNGGAPALVLQFDCAGRGRVLFGSCAADQIVRPLQESLGAETPWIGFHTYGEIAPIGGRLHYHNYTVALCALYELSEPA